MSDEKVLSQNASEGNTDGTEQTTVNESANSGENKNPEVLSQPDKKDKDFEKATHKYRSLFKEKKQEVEQLKQQLGELSQNSSSSLDKDEIRKIIEETISSQISPIRESLESQTKAQVIDEFASMPYSNELAEHIKSEFDKLPDGMDFRSKMMSARANAIANNLDVIIQANREDAKEEAYSNKEYKSTKSLGERTTQGESKSLLERFRSGEVSAKDYAENREEFDRLRRESLGL